jgi:hypothetical protein
VKGFQVSAKEDIGSTNSYCFIIFLDITKAIEFVVKLVAQKDTKGDAFSKK